MSTPGVPHIQVSRRPKTPGSRATALRIPPRHRPHPIQLTRSNQEVCSAHRCHLSSTGSVLISADQCWVPLTNVCMRTTSMIFMYAFIARYVFMYLLTDLYLYQQNQCIPDHLNNIWKQVTNHQLGVSQNLEAPKLMVYYYNNIV